MAFYNPQDELNFGIESTYQPQGIFQTGAQMLQQPQQQEVPVQEPLPTEEGWMTRIGSVLTNPDIMGGLNLIGASLSGQQDQLDSAMTAYTRRREKLMSDQEALAERIRQRQEKLADRDDERQYNERQDYFNQLYQGYTPESVQEFNKTGDQSVLVKKVEEITPYQQAQLDLERQRMEQAAADAAASRAAAYGSHGSSAPTTKEFNGVPHQWDSATGRWVPIEGLATPQVPEGQLDTSKLDYGPIKMGDTYVIHEKTATGDVIRAPRDYEIARYGLDKITAISTPGGQAKALQPYIAGEKEVPFSIANPTGTIGEKPIGSDLLTRFGGKDTRELYAWTNLMDAQGTIRGIEQAREAGASGINTQSEFNTFKQGFPPLDYSSQENFLASIRRQNDYIAEHNRRQAEKKANFPQYDSQGNLVGGRGYQAPSQEPAPKTSASTQSVPSSLAPRGSSGEVSWDEMN